MYWAATGQLNDLELSEKSLTMKPVRNTTERPQAEPGRYPRVRLAMEIKLERMARAGRENEQVSFRIQFQWLEPINKSPSIHCEYSRRVSRNCVTRETLLSTSS